MRIPGQAIRSGGTDREDRIGQAHGRGRRATGHRLALDTPSPQPTPESLARSGRRVPRGKMRTVSRQLRFGYKVSAEQFGPSALLDFTVAAEQCGFDTAAISDHFQPWRHTGGHAPFSLAWLGAAAQATTRIALGTSVLTPTFRYHPAVVAQAMGTLGSMFPGRFWLGVGTGEFDGMRRRSASSGRIPRSGSLASRRRSRSSRRS